MKRSPSLLDNLLVLLLFFCFGAAREARAVSLVIAPAETTVTVGDVVSLRVMVDAVPDLKGAELIYGYTPIRLTLTSAQAGGAINGVSGAFEFTYPDVTAPPDSAWMNFATLTGTGSGPGVVAFLTFGSHTQGNATVNCLFGDLRTSTNAQIPHSCAGALIHVIGPVPTRKTNWGRVKAHYR
jgi:hypothetical protein